MNGIVLTWLVAGILLAFSVALIIIGAMALFNQTILLMSGMCIAPKIVCYAALLGMGATFIALGVELAEIAFHLLTR